MDYTKQAEYNAAVARRKEANHLLCQLQGVGASKEDIAAAKELREEAWYAEHIAWEALYETFVTLTL